MSSDCALLTRAVKVMTLKGLVWLGKYDCTHLNRQRTGTLLFVFLLFLCSYFSIVLLIFVQVLLATGFSKCYKTYWANVCTASHSSQLASQQLANMLRLIDASGGSRHSSPPAHCLWLCVMDGS